MLLWIFYNPKTLPQLYSVNAHFWEGARNKKSQKYVSVCVCATLSTNCENNSTENIHFVMIEICVAFMNSSTWRTASTVRDAVVAVVVLRLAIVDDDAAIVIAIVVVVVVTGLSATDCGCA